MTVKIIASDLDGTLLQNGNREVSKKAIEYIKALNEKNVIFAAASGRQYQNLRKLFHEVKDDIAYICENGGFVKYHDEIIYKKTMDRTMGEEILDDIYSIEGCEFLLSGENVSYIKPKDKEYSSHIQYFVGNDICLIDDYKEVKEDFIKISVYCKDGIEKHGKYFEEKWGDKVKTTISGYSWLDLVAPEVNKGEALKKLMEKFNVTYEETMCFGDNYNDLDMFDVSYYSYAMTGANREIRNRARFVTPDVESILFDVNMIYQ